MLTGGYIINVYCLVDEMLKKIIKNSIRQRGSAPNLSDLSERFKIEKVRARDLWHLTVRAGWKLLAHTVYCYLNHIAGNPILQFDKLLT